MEKKELLEELKKLSESYKGTKTGDTIKQMYSCAILSELAPINDNVDAFSTKEYLDAIFNGKIKEGQIFGNIVRNRGFSAGNYYNYESYVDRLTNQVLNLFKNNVTGDIKYERRFPYCMINGNLVTNYIMYYYYKNIPVPEQIYHIFFPNELVSSLSELEIIQRDLKCIFFNKSIISKKRVLDAYVMSITSSKMRSLVQKSPDDMMNNTSEEENKTTLLETAINIAKELSKQEEKILK